MNYSHAIDKTVKDLLKATRRYFAKQTYLYGGGKVEFRRLPSEQYKSVMEIYFIGCCKNHLLELPIKVFFDLAPSDTENVSAVIRRIADKYVYASKVQTL